MDTPYADFLFLLLIFAGFAGLAAFAKVIELVTAQSTPTVVTADAAASPVEATATDRGARLADTVTTVAPTLHETPRIASANDAPRSAEEPRA